MTDADLVLYDVADGICTVTMNRPAQKNTLSFAMIDALNEAVKRADADPEVRVIILAGAGTTFCAGHDLSASGLMAYAEKGPNLESIWELEEHYYVHEHGLDIWETDTPTIAQVQGHAVIGGYQLANVCDLIVAAEDAIFWDPATRMYTCGAEMLMEPWVMSARRAKEFLFTGQQIDAQEAYRIGMVNRVVPNDRLREETLQLAGQIAAQPAISLKLAKRAVNKTMDMQGFKQAVEHAFLLHIIGHGTQAFQDNLWKPLLEKVADGGLGSYLKDRDAADTKD